MWHTLLSEDAATATLRSQPKGLRVGAVHRDSQLQRQITLQGGCVVWHQVRPLKINNQRANVFDQTRPFEQLEAQWPRRRIKRRDQKQALSRVTRNYSRQQIEVIVDDVRVNHLRGHINQASARLPQQQKQEKKA